MRSMTGSALASPHAHSVVPAVKTVPPRSCTPMTACPCARRATVSGSCAPSTRSAMYSFSEGKPSGTPRGAFTRLKCCTGVMARISRSVGVPSAPVGWGSPSRNAISQPSHS